MPVSWSTPGMIEIGINELSDDEEDDWDEEDACGIE
jgi:hypothetical protein